MAQQKVHIQGQDSLQRVVIFGDLGKAEADGSNEYNNFHPGSLKQISFSATGSEVVKGAIMELKERVSAARNRW
ncbi:hypothetical protein K1719_043579 [Acacia pycnantha]|nr:hypothetical protein K1719_043579 [Acacia pycnantha]